MHQAMTLAAASKAAVEFDPEQRDHRVAFAMLAEGGRQHPTLRFLLSPDYSSLLAMMQARMAIWAVRDIHLQQLPDGKIVERQGPPGPPPPQAGVTELASKRRRPG